MIGRVFVDTNVLFYSFTDFYLEKQKLASTIIETLILDNRLWASTQVVQELYHNLIKKSNLVYGDAEGIAETIMKQNVVINDLEAIKNAIQIQKRNQLSFWDSLIISAAASANCKYLLSEDLNHGQKIEGVKIVNPFL